MVMGKYSRRTKKTINVYTTPVRAQPVVRKFNTGTLDHIPHLTLPGTLAESVEASEKLGFTVIPGGTHAGGETSNALVVFADGTYLELIQFVQPPPTDSQHPWSKKAPGWIDYAFLGTGRGGDHSTAKYEELEGGRRREDGKILEWLISSIVNKDDRGKLPFFCGDVTPREWRVPLEPRSNVEHASTTIGITYVKLLVSPAAFASSTKQLTTVFGQDPHTSTTTEAIWDLDEQPSRLGMHKKAPQLVLRVFQNEEERGYIQTHGSEVYEIGFIVTESSKAGSADSPYGRLSWIAI
ncbi:glyoxalase-like domain-containing protein [Fomes fomentarius]|nr:glyoxalase-like domain-containing protein [Fomes fomentarius]